MKKTEIEKIQKAICELKEYADMMDDSSDKENLLNRANALEWVLTIADNLTR